MLNLKDLKLYLLISLLGFGVIASDIALIIENKTLQNSVSSVSNLKQRNKTLQVKVTQLEDKNKQLKSQLDDFMKLQMLEDKSEKPTSQSKEVLAPKEQEYNKLKEEYDSLSKAYNDLLKEGLATTPSQQQPEEEAQRERPTQQQMEQMRITIRDRTYETLDNRISQAKTQDEVNILNEMKQKYDNIFNLSDKFRTAEDEERTTLRDAIGEEWRSLGQLYQDYNAYQWQSLAREFGVTNTDEFIKRAQSLTQTNSPFGFFGRGGGERLQGPSTEQQPPQ